MGTWQAFYAVGSLVLALVGVGIAGWNLYLNKVKKEENELQPKQLVNQLATSHLHVLNPQFCNMRL
jgi:hypothetical protein